MPIPNSPRILVIELNRENDGRWIADIPEFPGVLVYSSSQNQAIANVQALALRALANQIEAQGIPQPVVQFTTRAAWRFSESVPANGLVTG